jgi:hypothetical protein
MSSDIEWTTTNRGKPEIIHNNQRYRKRCTNKDGSEMWVCCNKACGISIVLNQGVIKKYPIDHAHAGVKHSIEVRKVIEKVYDETKKDLLKPITEIYQEN